MLNVQEHSPRQHTNINSPRRKVGVGLAAGVNPHLAAGAIKHPLCRRAAGFSLVEILLSLGIFAIGMTAIVSLFPAAAILQRETTQEVISEMAAQSAASTINAKQLTYEWTGTASTGELMNYYSSAGASGTDAVSIAGLFTAADRSYPTGVIDLTALTVDEAIADCDMHWVPFIQDISGDPTNPIWVARLFIVEADSRANYSGTLPTGTDATANGADPATFPRVVSEGASATGAVFTTAAALDIEPGDVVMDNNGNSHVVVNVNNTAVEVLYTIAQVPNNVTTLWYAPKMGGSSSPGMRVVTVEVDVVAP